VTSHISSLYDLPEGRIGRTPSVEINQYSTEFESTTIQRSPLARAEAVKQKTMENPKIGCHEDRDLVNVPSASQRVGKLPEPNVSLRRIPAQTQVVPTKIIVSDSLTGDGYGETARDTIFYSAWRLDGGAQKCQVLDLVAPKTRNRGPLLSNRRGIAKYTYEQIKSKIARHISAILRPPLLIKINVFCKASPADVGNCQTSSQCRADSNVSICSPQN
jgi:hypothetical protein